MPFSVEFIQPEDYPGNDTDQVGGAISSPETQFSGTLGELFASSTSGFVGTPAVTRYMKVFLKNTGDEISDLSVFLQNVEYTDQLSIAFEASAGDTTTNALTMPSGYVSGDFTTPIGLANAISPASTTLAPNATVALWIKLSVPSGLTADSSATAVLSVAGTV